MSTYRELVVWQKSMKLVRNIYNMTREFPKSEIYLLSAQMRKSAISIPCNIAEGSKRNTKRDFKHFLIISYGSGAELETQLDISHIQHYIADELYSENMSLLNEVMKMLNSLINKLRDTLKD